MPLDDGERIRLNDPPNALLVRRFPDPCRAVVRVGQVVSFRKTLPRVRMCGPIHDAPVVFGQSPCRAPWSVPFVGARVGVDSYRVVSGGTEPRVAAASASPRAAAAVMRPR
jgi:hypothetical protein